MRLSSACGRSSCSRPSSGCAPRRQAQVPGIPVYNRACRAASGSMAMSASPTTTPASGTALGVTGRAGFGPRRRHRHRVHASIPMVPAAATSRWAPPSTTSSSAGRWFRSRSRSRAGSATPSRTTRIPARSASVEQLRFPVGLGFALTIPNPALAIKPWLAPRLDIVRTSIEGIRRCPTAPTPKRNFGLSGGIELNLLNGFGLQAAYDRVFGDGARSVVFGDRRALRLPGSRAVSRAARGVIALLLSCSRSPAAPRPSTPPRSGCRPRSLRRRVSRPRAIASGSRARRCSGSGASCASRSPRFARRSRRQLGGGSRYRRSEDQGAKPLERPSLHRCSRPA